MKTVLTHLKSKTVQGILGLVVIGLLKNYNVEILPAELLNTLGILFTGWLGIGIRNAVKPIKSE